MEKRVAIVTDTGWVRHTVKAVRFLIPSEIRVFSTIEAEEGRAWITAPLGSDGDAQIAAQPVRTRLLQPRRMRRSSATASVPRARRPQPRPPTNP